MVTDEQILWDGPYKCIVDVWNLVDRIRVLKPDGEALYEWTTYRPHPDSEPSERDDAFAVAEYHRTIADYIEAAIHLSEGHELAIAQQSEATIQ